MGMKFNPLLFSGFDLVNPSGGVPTVPTVGSLPPSGFIGQLYVAQDTGYVYEWRGSSWVIVAGPGVMLGIGPIDSQPPSADGAVDANEQLIMQSASATVPGLVNNTTQTFSGNKTIQGVGGGQVDALTLTSGGNTDLIIRNTVGGPLGLLIGNNAGPTPDYQIYNLDGGTFTINSAAGIIFNSNLDMAGNNIINVTPVPNGVATLDGAGKIPVNQLPNSVMEIQGVWDASSNTPTLVDGTGNIGDVYLVSVAGTQDLGSGPQTFVVKDWVLYNSSGVWQKSHGGADAVLSVNGFSGVVNLTTTDIPEGSNLYFTNARAQAAAVQDTIVDGVINIAPSQNAVFDALATKASATGTANTIRFFNASGNDSTSANLKYLSANNNFQLTNSGGTVTQSSTDGFIVGHMDSGSSMTTSGPGAMILAYGSIGSVTATALGSKVFGTANDGQMHSTGIGSMAMGMAYAGVSGSANVEATGDGAITLGVAVTGGLIRASGFGSLATGTAISAGGQIISSGTGSFAGGLTNGVSTTISGDGAFGWGTGLLNASLGAVYFGQYAVASPSNPSTYVATDPLFVLGNGSGTGSRSNAFQVDKDGRHTTTGAHIDKFRVATGSTTLSARTDYKVICNATAGGPFTLTLPAGVQGLNFVIGQTVTNTQVFTITPTGGDTLDTNIQAIFNNNQPVPVTFDSGTGKWYAI